MQKHSAGRVAESSKTMNGVPGSGTPDCRARLNVQSGRYKLKPNGLVSSAFCDQCFLK